VALEYDRRGLRASGGGLVPDADDVSAVTIAIIGTRGIGLAHRVPARFGRRDLRFAGLKSVIDEMADSLTDKVRAVPSNPIGLDAYGNVVRLLAEGRSSGTVVAGWLPTGARFAISTARGGTRLSVAAASSCAPARGEVDARTQFHYLATVVTPAMAHAQSWHP
jgi:hypothetical protein